MKMDISPRDWQELSAYLDQQLNSRARSRLEARLRDEPQLRIALQDLQRNKMLLRSQPRLFAPRNFTLTPQMAKIRPVSPAYPVVRLVAAMSSILLIIVLAGDLLVGGPLRVTYQDVVSPYVSQQASQPVEREIVVTVEVEAAVEPAAKSAPEALQSAPPPAAPTEAPMLPTESPAAALRDAQTLMATEAPVTMEAGAPGTEEQQPTMVLAETPVAQEAEPTASQAPAEATVLVQQVTITPEPTSLPPFSLANLAILGIEFLLAMLAVLALMAAIFLGRAG